MAGVMNHTSPFALAFTVLATCGLATASPTDDVATMLQRVATSPTKTVTFFQGLAALDDCDVGGADLQAALERGGVEADGLLGAFLGGLKRIRKSGSDVVLTRAKTVRFDTGSGLVEVGQSVAFRVAASKPGHVSLTRLGGAKAGYGPLSLLPVRTLTLDVDAKGLTTASLNVGYGFLSKTVAVVLARPKSPGIAAAIDQ
jgi:hypothetical protein